MRWFTYTDAGNYNFRLFKATRGAKHHGQRQAPVHRIPGTGTHHQRRVNNFYQQWGEGLNNWARNQTVWTGTEWFTCPTEFVHEATPWDASGRSESALLQGQQEQATCAARATSAA